MIERNYKGFCLEFQERVNEGFPIDQTTMIEMAEKYNTPILGSCEHSSSAYFPWVEDPESFEQCRYCRNIRVIR